METFEFLKDMAESNRPSTLARSGMWGPTLLGVRLGGPRGCCGSVDRIGSLGDTEELPIASIIKNRWTQSLCYIGREKTSGYFLAPGTRSSLATRAALTF